MSTPLTRWLTSLNDTLVVRPAARMRTLEAQIESLNRALGALDEPDQLQAAVALLETQVAEATERRDSLLDRKQARTLQRAAAGRARVESRLGECRALLERARAAADVEALTLAEGLVPEPLHQAPARLAVQLSRAAPGTRLTGLLADCLQAGQHALSALPEDTAEAAELDCKVRDLRAEVSARAKHLKLDHAASTEVIESLLSASGAQIGPLREQLSLTLLPAARAECDWQLPVDVFSEVRHALD